MITPAIKMMIDTAKISRQEAANALGISAQALSNKYTRGSFTAPDLIKIAAACGVRLAFVDERGKAIVTFPEPTKEE